jgi:hypothetical protein
MDERQIVQAEEEIAMRKNIAAAAAVIALLSVCSVLPAQAGGATSAASKYNANYSAQGTRPPAAQAASYTLTEFSSSSAPTGKSSASKR